jgi:hypothetical protein
MVVAAGVPALRHAVLHSEDVSWAATLQMPLPPPLRRPSSPVTGGRIPQVVPHLKHNEGWGGKGKPDTTVCDK